MKKSLFTAAFVAMTLPVVAQIMPEQSATVKTGRDCINGISTIPYDLRGVSETGITVKKGDQITLLDEKNGGTLYGQFIHLTNGAFGPRGGCTTPACMRYAEFPEYPMGAMLLMLIDNRQEVVNVLPVGPNLGKKLTVGAQGGRIVFATNEFPEYRNDNNGRGTIMMRLACGK